MFFKSKPQSNDDSVKYLLDEEHIPKSWYNIAADLPEPPLPPLSKCDRPCQGTIVNHHCVLPPRVPM